ncbi:MAG TPA: dTDP-4-dehydrorhamnose 3,5-epimerase [Bacteroidales bacterium]|nr:dTDP-4-dehydrorhamnose 3,5-epimerase [Bacteroidales bacterium]
MEFIQNEISGLLVIKPDIFRDDRGYFFESFNQDKFDEEGLDLTFVQDNESCSKKGVVRGLHFQVPPFEQGKLVRVIRGSILDVAVDIRKGSPTFGKWSSVVLSGENKWMYWIPPGFAHGFSVLEEDSVVMYKCTNVYHKDAERSIIWNDPDLKIDWGTAHPIVSEKDNKAPFFKEVGSPF